MNLNSYIGILNIDKPSGLSSARVVSRVKRVLPRGIKIGHAGTLDPFATGVLLLLIGKATRLCEQLMDSAKQYEATIKLGATTETDDPESPEQQAEGVKPIASDAFARAMKGFVGAISQRPPIFSAMKIGGRRAYDLARKGKPVQLEPRTVRVYGMELLDFNWPFARVRIDCGRGTYIRSIARDIGHALGVGGYLTQLRRTRVGSFIASDAVALDGIDLETITNSLRQLPAADKPEDDEHTGDHDLSHKGLSMLDRTFIPNYEQGADQLAAAVAGLTQADLLAFPIPNTWSIQQIVIHVADADCVLMDRMKRVIAEDNPPLVSFNETLWAQRLHMEQQSAADAVETVRLVRRQIGRILRAIPDSDFDRIGTHSEAGPLSLKTLVEKATGHLVHHLKFIINKRQKLGK